MVLISDSPWAADVTLVRCKAIPSSLHPRAVLPI
jgi:hypothetical protein